MGDFSSKMKMEICRFGKYCVALQQIQLYYNEQ